MATTKQSGSHLETSPVRFRRILVGVDLSPASKLILQHAMAIADLYGAEVKVVSVLAPLIPGDGIEPASPMQIEAEMDAIREQLERLAESCRIVGVPLSTEATYGNAVALLEETALAIHADLIVLGSQGDSGITRMVLGSTAEAIARVAPCPVMIVGPACEMRGKPFESILYASDLEIDQLRAAQYAAALAERVDGQLTLLYVIEDQDERTRERTIPAEALARLQQLLPQDAALYCKPEFQTRYGTPGETVPAVAAAMHASLVVLGSKRRGLLASHAPWTTLARVVREARCPVLVVPGHLR
ncbi:MAG: universal stress protein [Acidobacteriota bacterium]|nr:universal stress protein [Acidobacteriota bacterium]